MSRIVSSSSSSKVYRQLSLRVSQLALGHIRLQQAGSDLALELGTVSSGDMLQWQPVLKTACIETMCQVALNEGRSEWSLRSMSC